MESNVKQKTQRERLEILVIHLKITLRELAQMVGVNENTLYHTNSGTKNRLSERTAAKICYYVEKKLGVVVNREWLLNGEGDMIDKEYSVGCPDGVEGEAKDRVEELPTDSEEGIDWKARYLDLLEKYTSLLENKQ